MYRNPRFLIGSQARRKAHGNSTAQELNGVQIKTIKAAADHLAEAGEHEGVPSMLRSAHKFHAKELKDLIK
jgi:hypothetical protein